MFHKICQHKSATLEVAQMVQQVKVINILCQVIPQNHQCCRLEFLAGVWINI